MMDLAHLGGVDVTLLASLLALAAFLLAAPVAALHRAGGNVVTLLRRARQASQLQIAIGALLVLPAALLLLVAHESIAELLSLSGGMIVATFAIASGALLGATVGGFRAPRPPRLWGATALAVFALAFAVSALPAQQHAPAHTGGQPVIMWWTPVEEPSEEETEPPAETAAPTPTQVVTALPYLPQQVTFGERVLRVLPPMICVKGMGQTPVSLWVTPSGAITVVLHDGTARVLADARPLRPCNATARRVLHASGESLETPGGGAYPLTELTPLAWVGDLVDTSGVAYTLGWHNVDGDYGVTHVGLIRTALIRD